MSPTKSDTVDQLRGDILSDAMRKLQANPALLPAGYHSATVEPGVAMLVEPVNDHPFVFVPPTTVHMFESAPGSGTDHLRQRMLAGLFFRGVVDAARAAAFQVAASVADASTPRRGARP